MRITIEHIPAKGGWFSDKKPRVRTTIVFSEEERAVIDQRRLWNATVYTVPLAELDPQFEPTRDLNITIKDMTKGAYRVCSDLVKAKNWEHELRTTILPRLKNYIDGNTNEATRSDTFEL